MPQIKIDHIVTFSSEDPVHTANNILSEDTSKKWKCKSPGEKNAVIVLQLEKASVITAVDIGNEHSAYIEVLVSRSCASNDDYKVLLVMSSFMTPVESRNSQNTNKVRMFTKENLSKPECNEKWDRVKVVCTQPFNKHVQYGLSFIKFHSNDTVSTDSSPMQIGNFAIRPNSPDLSIGSLFKKRNEVKQEEKLSGAAAIREASSAPPILKPKLKINSPASSTKDRTSASDHSPKRRNRNELLYSKEEEEPNEKIDKIIKKVKEDEENKREKELKATKKESTADKKKTKESKNSDKKKVKDAKNSPNSSRKRKDDDHSKHTKIKKPKTNRLTKPFDKLLEGVTLVISGIQNPDRANLRSMALSMGSKYKSDWDNTCTHLICAFPNTPKFNQVKGKGKIVKRSWIEDCHNQRKRLPWRRYALDKDDTNKNESEEEIWDQVEAEPAEEMEIENIDTNNEHDEDASDTEERLVRLQENKKRRGSNEIDSVYSADTDKEDLEIDDQGDADMSSKAGKLPELFDEKFFYVDHSLDEEMYNKLFRYIIGYNGIPVVDLSDNINFIVTTKRNSSTFKEIYRDVQCVSPNWIWECHNKQKLIPVDSFLY